MPNKKHNTNLNLLMYNIEVSIINLISLIIVINKNVIEIIIIVLCILK